MSHLVALANLVTPAALANAFVAMQAAQVKLDEIRSAYKAAQYVGKTEARIVRPFLDEATAEYEAATRAYTGLAARFEAQGEAYLQQDKITIRTAEEWTVIEHYRSVFHADLTRMFAEHGYTEATASKSRELDKFLSALKRWSADEALERTIRATDKLVDTTDRFLDTLRGSYREDEIAEFKPFLVAAIRASKRNTMLTRDEHLKAINAAYTALEAKLNESVAA